MPRDDRGEDRHLPRRTTGLLDNMAARRQIGVGVLGMGWMGHVHSRSYLAAAHRFPDLGIEPVLVACADASQKVASDGAEAHRYASHTTNWREVVDNDKVEVVSVCLPNSLHAEACEAIAAAGKHIWCEKPVGRNAVDTARAARAIDKANVASMSGFNYRWVPMVRYVRELLDSGELGEIEMFRGRFYSMYAYDRLGLFSWRFKSDIAGNGVVGDLISHVADLALEMAGPINEVCAHKRVFIEERPLPKEGSVSHYARGEPGDPTAKVENEDFAGALVRFSGGACGVLEGWRTACGPKSDMGFELYCTNGSVSWTLEDMNALQIYMRDKGPMDGYARVLAGEGHPEHSRFIPGDGNPIGYEDTKAIEAARLLEMIVEGKTQPSGLRRASEVADVGAAILRSCESDKWESVTATDPDS